MSFMTERAFAVAPWTAAILVFLGSGLSCGARTGLPLPDSDEPLGGGGAPPITGGGGEGGLLGGGGTGGEGGAPPPDCVPGALLVYLVSEQSNLYSYKPSTGELKLKGALTCDFNDTPFSMSVDRKGLAYVHYWQTGELYFVNTKDASCEPSDFQPNQHGFQNFGMGFARDLATETDQLFVSEISFGMGAASKGLARIDTDTLELSFVGNYDNDVANHMEMTSSDDGNLYGYSLAPAGGGHLVQIDKTNAHILSATFLPVGQGSEASSLAFAYWNEDFYIFTGANGVTDVNRYRPADGSLTLVQQLSDVIVGAGVSTCDPMP
ncbi:MAG: hypothetical protein U0271_30940 [Polyangiaceae bacterium]